MTNLYNYLIENSFEKHKECSLKKMLFSDVYLEIKPDEAWESSKEFYFYLFSKSFSDVMFKLFENESSPAWSFKPRKLRKDTEGCLGMVQLAFKEDAVFQNSLLDAGRGEATLQELINSVNQIGTEQQLFELIYGGVVSKLVVMIEGVWVYLYLCKLNEFTKTIVMDKATEDKLRVYVRRWNIKTPLNESIISYFYDCYDRVLGQSTEPLLKLVTSKGPE